jgi:hypothetical protein
VCQALKLSPDLPIERIVEEAARLVKLRDGLISCLQCSEAEILTTVRQNMTFVRQISGPLVPETFNEEAQKVLQEREIVRRIGDLLAVRHISQIEHAVETLQETNRIQELSISTLNEVCSVVGTVPNRIIDSVGQLSDAAVRICHLLQLNPLPCVPCDRLVQTIEAHESELLRLRSSVQQQKRLATELRGSISVTEGSLNQQGGTLVASRGSESSVTDDVIASTMEQQARMIRDLKSEISRVTQTNDSLRSQAREVIELLESSPSHNGVVEAIRQLQLRIRSLESDLITQAAIFEGSNTGAGLSEVRGLLRAAQQQMVDLRTVLGIEGKAFSAVISSVKLLKEQLASEREQNDSHLRVIRDQEGRIELLKIQYDEKADVMRQTLQIREASLSRIFRCFGAAQSDDLVVDGIEELRRQINDLHTELASYRMAQSLDSIFTIQTGNDRQLVNNIQQALAQQAKLIRGIVVDLTETIQRRIPAAGEVNAMLKTVSEENQRLMELLDPSVPTRRVHVGPPEALHPFLRTEREMFVKTKRVREPTCTQESATLL